MSEPVTVGEFTRAFDALSRQLAALQATSQEVLGEARKTNGRVNGLERLTAEHGVKLKNLEREVFDGADNTAAPPKPAPPALVDLEEKPITRRDLAVALGAVGLLMAAIKWLPALVAAGKVSP